jgi:hypothetical protein
MMTAAVLAFEWNRGGLDELVSRMTAVIGTIKEPDEFILFCFRTLGVADVTAINNKKLFIEVSDELDNRTRRIFDAAGGGRFGLTLLMAGAYECLFPAIKDAWDAKTIPKRTLDKHAQRSIAFLDDVVDQVGSLAPRFRTSEIIKHVLRLHQTLHEGNRELTLQELFFAVRFAPPASLKVDIEKVFAVQQWILWHLAVIGVPMTASTLAQCPLVREAIEGCFASGARVSEELYTNVVKTTLDLMVTRCIVFRLRPTSGAPESTTFRVILSNFDTASTTLYGVTFFKQWVSGLLSFQRSTDFR